jgi:hypothetical protein
MKKSKKPSKNEIKETSGRSDKEILEQAKRRFQIVTDLHSDERRLQSDDGRFADEDQWEPEVRAARENDPNGARPVLTIDKINQYISQIVNDLRQNKPAIKVKPVDDAADKDTARVFQEIIRRIEDNSNATIAYLTGGESAVKVGEGYWHLTTDYVDAKSFDQEVRIEPIHDYSKVFMSEHNMPDGSDNKYTFIIEDVPDEKFKRLYPKAKDGSSTEFSVANDAKDSMIWRIGATTRVALYYYYDYEDTLLYALEDGTTMLQSEYEAFINDKAYELPAVVSTRPTQLQTVKWVKMTGAEILERGVWLGKYIPVIKVVGKQANVNGKKHYKGLVRLAKDSLRAYNYWFSALTEKLALAPKAPFIGAKGQFDTDRAKWQSANVVNHAFLQYDTVLDSNNVALPPPQRQLPAQMEAAMLQHLQLIEHDIKTALGMFRASVGEASPQQSGKAIQSLKIQSDTGSFNFPDNVALSIRYTGKQLIDIIPKLYDTARIVRIMGEDGTVSTVGIDPAQEEAKLEGKIGNIYNLRVGKYDVTATPGASYATKRMEQSEILQGFLQNNPEQFPMFGDLLFRMQDFPLSDKIADRFERMLPPEVKIQEGDIPPEIQQLMQQLEQERQQLDQKAAALNEAELEINKAGQEVGKQAIEVMAKEENVKTGLDRLAVKKEELELMLKEIMINGDNVESQVKLQIAALDQETKYVLALLDEGSKERSDMIADKASRRARGDLSLEMEEREEELKRKEDESKQKEEDERLAKQGEEEMNERAVQAIVSMSEKLENLQNTINSIPRETPAPVVDTSGIEKTISKLDSVIKKSDKSENILKPVNENKEIMQEILSYLKAPKKVVKTEKDGKTEYMVRVKKRG